MKILSLACLSSLITITMYISFTFSLKNIEKLLIFRCWRHACSEYTENPIWRLRFGLNYCTVNCLMQKCSNFCMGYFLVQISNCITLKLRCKKVYIDALCKSDATIGTLLHKCLCDAIIEKLQLSQILHHAYFDVNLHQNTRLMQKCRDSCIKIDWCK